MPDERQTEGDVDDLFSMVKRRYGQRLTEEELAEVRKGVQRGVERAETLRSVPLDSSVEPFSVFVPYRGED